MLASRSPTKNPLKSKQPIRTALFGVLLVAQIQTTECLQPTNPGMQDYSAVSTLSFDMVATSSERFNLNTHRSASQVIYDMHSGFRTAVAEQLLLARSDSGIHGAKLIMGASIVASMLLFAGAVAAYFRLLSSGQPSANMLCSSAEAQPSTNSQPGTNEANASANEENHGSNPPSKQKDDSSKSGPPLRKVLFYVLGHSISASTLVIVNKWAMQEFHAPVPAGQPVGHAGYMWTLVVFQFLSAAAFARVAAICGLVQCDSLVPQKAMAFFPAASMFMITIVAGNAVMNYSNVNTFLVLRSLVPLPCNLLEILVYRDPCPPCASWIAMLITVAGAVGYATAVGGIEMSSIAWAAIFLVTMPVDGLLIKHSVSSCGLSPWGLVYYNNLLAALPALVFMFLFEIPNMDAFRTLCAAALTPSASLAIGVSCLIGISLSFFQLNTRFYISATAFMVLGVVNKFLTVLINKVVMEDQGLVPLLCIVGSLAGAILWQQTVKGNVIKVRAASHSFEQSFMLPFALSCAGLAWAAYIQYSHEHSRVKG